MEERQGTKIKICGLKRQVDIDMVNRYLPDYAGFVFYPKSSRYIESAGAAELIKKLRKEIIPVGVFLKSSPEEICEIALQTGIRRIQIHGEFSEKDLLSVRQKTGIPVIRAFSVSSKEDVKKAEASRADEILLDHGAGGTGRTFSWELLEGCQRPYFLAGGLNTENLGRAVHELHPFAADLSSGAETDGVKDEKKIQELIRIVRESD